MDSLTQITLGAAVGEAVLGRRIGNRALWWGAAFGTLPDLDVVMTPFVDSIGFIVHHRAASHSFLGAAIASPLLALLFRRRSARGGDAIGFGRWLTFFVLVFVTHILLDCLTAYGTQIWWPFSDERVAWNTVFIIDPLYTLPLLAGVTSCAFLGRDRRARRALNAAGLIASCAYLAFGALAKEHVEARLRSALESRSIAARRLLTLPTPFNSILWCGVAETRDGYWIGYRSLLDESPEVELRFVRRNAELLGDLRTSRTVDRLVWFANGYYAVRNGSNGPVIDILNFGRLDLEGDEPSYPFSYAIERSPEGGVEARRASLRDSVGINERLAALWERLLGR